MEFKTLLPHDAEAIFKAVLGIDPSTKILSDVPVNVKIGDIEPTASGGMHGLDVYCQVTGSVDSTLPPVRYKLSIVYWDIINGRNPAILSLSSIETKKGHDEMTVESLANLTTVVRLLIKAGVWNTA